MADESEDEDALPSRRRYCTLADITIARLNRLKAKGTHGRSVPTIMTNMIEKGIREAIDDGYLGLDDD